MFFVEVNFGVASFIFGGVIAKDSLAYAIPNASSRNTNNISCSIAIECNSQISTSFRFFYIGIIRSCNIGFCGSILQQVTTFLALKNKLCGFSCAVSTQINFITCDFYSLRSTFLVIAPLGHKLNGVAFTVYASGTFDKNNYIFSHNIILKLILPCCKLLRVKAGNIAKLLTKKFFAQLCKALYFIGNKKLHFAALPG